MTALPMHTSTGRSSSTSTIAIAPGTAVTLLARLDWLVRPGLDLHRGARRQGGDTDGAACRAVVPNPATYASLNVAKVSMSVRKHSVLAMSVSVAPTLASCARRFSTAFGGLRGNAAADERAVLHAELAADDDPVASTNDGGVRAKRFAHVGIVRATPESQAQLLHWPTMSMSRRHLSPAPGRCSSSQHAVTIPRRTRRLSRRAGTEPDPGTTGFTIAQRYPSNTFVPGKVRLPISLANKQSLLTTGPAVLNGRVLDSTDKQIATVIGADSFDGHRDPLLADRRRRSTSPAPTRCDSMVTTASAPRSRCPIRRRSPCRTSGRRCRRSTRRRSTTTAASSRIARSHPSRARCTT